MRRDHADLADQLISCSLIATKSQTISGIYKRIRGGDDGRIRTVLSPVGTETGRFSSSDTFLEASTNLQNLPKKVAALDPLYDARSCMVPRAGWAFVEADLSQAEARATSAYAGDLSTLALFDSGKDIHKWTASQIFGCSASDVTKSQRHLGKMARHALNYGMGWELFLERINKDADMTGVAITARQAKQIVAAYHAMNAPLLKWWQAVWQTVQQQGYLVTQPFGRRRDFLSPYVKPTDVYAYLPQSTIADLLNWRMSVAFKEDDLIGRYLLLQIHDAVLCECPADEAQEVASRLKRWLTEPITINGISLTVPVDVSIGTDSWATMEAV